MKQHFITPDYKIMIIKENNQVRAIDLEKLAYIDQNIINENYKSERWVSDKLVPLLKSVAGQAWEVVKPVLASAFPDEGDYIGWMSLIVDAGSLILDVLGPFTGGLTSVLSAVIDIFHGLFYVVASQGGNSIIPDKSDKEVEYLFAGMATLGFAVVPAYGNVAGAAARSMIKKYAGKVTGPKFLNMILKSPIGKGLVEGIEFLLSKGNAVIGLITGLVEKLTKKGPMKWFLNKLGITKLVKWFADSFDFLMKKFVTMKPIREALLKMGVDQKLINKYLKKGAQAGATKGVASATQLAIKKKAKQYFTQRVAGEIPIKQFMKDITGLLDSALEYMGFKSLKAEPYVYKPVNNILKNYGWWLNSEEREMIDLNDYNPQVIKKTQSYLNQVKDKIGLYDELSVDGDIGGKTLTALHALYLWMTTQEKDGYPSLSDEKFNSLKQQAEKAVQILDDVEMKIIEKAYGEKATESKILTFSDWIK